MMLVVAITTSKLRKQMSANTLRLLIATSVLGMTAIIAAKTEAAIVALLGAIIIISVPRWFKLPKQKMMVRVTLAVG